MRRAAAVLITASKGASTAADDVAADAGAVAARPCTIRASAACRKPASIACTASGAAGTGRPSIAVSAGTVVASALSTVTPRTPGVRASASRLASQIAAGAPARAGSRLTCASAMWSTRAASAPKCDATSARTKVPATISSASAKATWTVRKSARRRAPRTLTVRLVPFGLQDRRDVAARGLECGHETGQHRRQARHGRRVGEHRRVERHVDRAELAEGGEDDVQRPRADEDAERAAREREEQRLAEQEQHDAPAAGAGGETDRNLAAPADAARQQQVGDVRAGDPQQRRDDHERDHRDQQELDALLG